MFTASLLSRLMQSPSQTYYGAAKRVLRYLNGTANLGIWFRPAENACLKGYVDSDWADCTDDSKTTIGYLFTLGSGTFSWSSKKQVVAQSTAEAEYVAETRAVNQAAWLKKILQDLGQKQKEQLQFFVTIICYCHCKKSNSA